MKIKLYKGQIHYEHYQCIGILQYYQKEIEIIIDTKSSIICFEGDEVEIELYPIYTWTTSYKEEEKICLSNYFSSPPTEMFFTKMTIEERNK